MGQAIFILCSVILALSPAGLSAQPISPAILFNSETVLDGSYNQSLLSGMEKFRSRKGIAFAQDAQSDPELYVQSLKALSAAGHTPILVPGAHIRPLVESVAPLFPATTFIAIDYEIDLPNVRSVVFDERQGAFLAGVLAGRLSSGKKAAFLGGLPVRPVRALQEGFEAGFDYAAPGGRVTVKYLAAVTDRPWDDAAKAHELSAGLYRSGHDVVFAAAGNAGRGVLKAAFENGQLAIGVDRNQNGLYPGHVLTSVVKHLDRAVYVALISERWRLWRSPVKRLGLAQGGISISIDEHNRSLLTPEVMAELDRIRTRLLLDEPVALSGEGSHFGRMERPEAIELVVPEEVQPPFITSGAPEPSGMAVDIMTLASEQLGVTVQYKVLPTRRGFHLIRHNQTDGMLFSLWNPELEKYGRYPLRDGQPDSNRAMMIWDLAAFQRTDAGGGDSFSPRAPITLPPGSAAGTLKILDNHEAHVIATPERQLEMLVRGHTNTALAEALYADHLVATKPSLRNKVQKVADSVLKEAAYLVLSPDFYQRYPEFSELLWNRISQIRESVMIWDKVDRYFSETENRLSGKQEAGAD